MRNFFKALLRYLLSLFWPVPVPSKVSISFEEFGMTHKVAVVAIPEMRQDEKDYSPAIIHRELNYTIDDGPTNTVSVALDTPEFEINEVPDSSSISIGLANVAADGRKSNFNVQVFKAPDPEPTPPAPVPEPDAPSVKWKDAPEPGPNQQKKAK